MVRADAAAAGGTGARRSWAPAALAVVPALFFGVFFAWPVATIVATGLTPEGGADPGALLDVVTDRGLRGVAWFTLWQAVVSTLLTLLIGLPGAYVVARLRFPGRALLRAVVTVPFVLPTVVVASAFQALFGTRGLLPFRLTGSVAAILIAHVFFNYAVVVRTVGGLWAHLDPRVEDAARVLGASRWRVWREVTYPLLRPAIASAAAIVFLFTFTSFGVVLLLGGPGQATIEVEIYRSTAQLLDLPTASILALLQLLGVGAALFAYGRLRRRQARRQRLVAAAHVATPPRSAGQRWLLAGVLLTVAVLLVTPLAVLVERSVATADGYGLDHYLRLGESRRGSTLFVPPVAAIANSLWFAAQATLLAVVVGGLAATAVVRSSGRLGRALDTVLMVPLGVSAVTVGFGFLITLDTPPFDLRASAALVPIAQALVAVPFVIRTLVPVMEAVDRRLREAAAVLGAPPWRVWREVDLPMVARAGLAGAGFAFAVSLGEFGATVFLARVDRPTMPVAIFRFLSQPGAVNFGQAMAMSVALMAVTAAAVLLIERVRVADVGGF